MYDPNDVHSVFINAGQRPVLGRIPPERTKISKIIGVSCINYPKCKSFLAKITDLGGK